MLTGAVGATGAVVAFDSAMLFVIGVCCGTIRHGGVSVRYCCGI